jgi:PAS domain S-box-containing protein
MTIRGAAGHGSPLASAIPRLMAPPGLRRVSRSIQSWLVTLVAVALIPVLSFTVFIVLSLVERERATMASGLEDTARALALAVDLELEGSITTLQGLATSEKLAAKDDAGLSQQLEQARTDARRGWWTAAVLDETGRTVASLRPFVDSSVWGAIVAQDGFRAAMAAERPWISDGVGEPGTEARMVVVAVPVAREGARPRILGAVLRTDSLARNLFQHRLPAGVSAHVLDREQRAVVHLPSTTASPVPEGELARVVRRYWAEGFGRVPVPGREAIYAAVARSPLSGWTVTLVVPEDAFEAPWRRWLMTMIGGGVVLLLVGLGLASVAAGRIARPIATLSSRARALGRGEVPSATFSGISEVDDLERTMIAASAAREQAESAVRASEARYRAIVEDQTELVCRFRPDGTLTFVNPAYAQYFGRPPEALVGDRFGPTVHPADRERVMAEVGRLSATRPVVTMETRSVAGAGTVRWTQWITRALSAENGQIVEIQAVGRDITDRKRAELALERSTRDLEARARQQAAVARLGQLALAGADLAALLREATELLCATLGAEFCRVLERTADGQSLLTRASVGWPTGHEPVSVRASSGSQVELVLRTREPVIIEDVAADGRFSDAAEFTARGIVSGMSVVIHGGAGPYGTLAVHTTRRRAFTTDDVNFLQSIANILADAAARGRAEADRAELLAHAQEARVAAEQANRAKDEFLAMLSHELRNPLAAIVNASRLLEQRGEPADRTAHLGAIVARQSEHLARMVDDLLDVSRLASGKIVLRREPVDLKQVVERATAVLREAGRTARHELRVEAGSVFVKGDATRIDQVVFNLLDNALKYTPPGGLVGVEVGRDGDRAMLRVRDTGVGIAPEILPHVFDLFVQAHRSLDRAEGGLGLGLTLVRRLVELHGGTVSVSSSGPGQGSEFLVELPTMAGAEAPDALPPIPLAAEARRRILVVEDNPDARETLVLLLESWGHQVEQAGDGESALARAAAVPFDVALVDVGLPGMDGYTVAERLRAIPSCAHLHLVALTGYSRERDRHRAGEAGFHAYLVKPVDPAHLSRVLGGGPAG